MDRLDKVLNAANDYEFPAIQDAMRRAGLIWEHVGCWTNDGDDETCEQCGRTIADLRADEDEGVLTS
jgi:hypothetical protein